MTTWLMDTALFKTLGSPRTRQWFEDNEASVFLSAVSLAEVGAYITKISPGQRQRASALRAWFRELASRYADRIHPVDHEIAIRAGELTPSVQNGHSRHRSHDALLVATAQIHGHGLLTRREGIFGSWIKVPIATV